MHEPIGVAGRLFGALGRVVRRAAHRPENGAHDVRHRRGIDPAGTEFPRGLLDQRRDDAGREADRPGGQQAGGPRLGQILPQARLRRLRDVRHRADGAGGETRLRRCCREVAQQHGDGRGHAGQRIVDGQAGRLQALVQLRDQRLAELRLQRHKILEVQVERALRQPGGLRHRLHRHGVVGGSGVARAGGIQDRGARAGALRLTDRRPPLQVDAGHGSLLCRYVIIPTRR